MSLEELKESVLEKARKKAERIVEEARRKAREIVEEAKKEYWERYRREKELMLRKIREEEFRKYSAKLLELNSELLIVKRKLIDELVNTATERIRNLPPEIRKESLRRLIKESMEAGIIKDNFVIKVVNRDVDLVKDCVRELDLTDRLASVGLLPDDMLGGLVIEDTKGDVAIDNTYSTRLERALRIIYEKVNEEVLKG